MHALQSNLTAALLVIHAMIGCCHHHWHCDEECAAVVKLCAAPCQCCEPYTYCEPCCGSHNESEQPSQPCNGELQCQGVCTYLPPQKTVIDASDFDSGLEFAAVIPTYLDGHLAAAALPWDLAHTLNDSPPPLRLHLLHQILLI